LVAVQTNYNFKAKLIEVVQAEGFFESDEAAFSVLDPCL